MHLVSRTRKLTGPQGLPKVYFACHPADREKYLPDTAAMLLQRKNCSLWYDDGPAEDFDPEEFRNILADMRLAVVPVTRRLLTEPNRAADRELALIRDSRIPLLPLIEEPGLLQAYTARFGRAQFLTPARRDASALSFEEKLTLFLDHVLPDDELGGRIRAAFDGNIFISYRKKDRWLMRPLLPLIHSRERYQALSFWYDEHLVPGEDFSDNIQKALADSSVVLLAVTDSILEPGNYVLRSEYPAARQAGKPILPVELAATDRAALAAAYPDLPPLAGKDDAQALFAALDRALEAAGVRPRPLTAERSFLLGMAYMTGVGVETDLDRALDLLAGAAHAGWAEAAVRLRECYRQGQYVEPSLEQAASWAELAMDILDGRFRQEETEENCAALMAAARSAGDLFRQEGGPKARERARTCYAVMAGAAGRLASDWGSDEGARLRALAQADLGILWRDEGNAVMAIACLEQANQALDARHRRLDTRQSAWDLAQSANLLAGIYKALAVQSDDQQALLAQAEALYREACGLLRPWAEGDAGVMRNLAGYCYNLGAVLSAAHRPSPAAAQWVQAYELFCQLAEASMERAQWYEAEDYCGHLRAVISCLSGSMPYAVEQRVQAEQHLRLGLICLHTGRPDQAMGHFTLSLNYADRWQEKTGSLEDAGPMLAHYGRLREALRPVCRSAPELKTLDQFTLSCYAPALFLEKHGDPAGAADLCRQAVEMLTPLAEGGALPQYSDRLFNWLERICSLAQDAAAAAGDARGAVTYADLSAVYAGRLFAKTHATAAADRFTAALLRQAELCDGSQRQQILQSAEDLWDQLASNGREEPDAAHCADQMAGIYLARGRLSAGSERIEALDTALRIWQNLNRDFPNTVHYYLCMEQARRLLEQAQQDPS